MNKWGMELPCLQTFVRENPRGHFHVGALKNRISKGMWIKIHPILCEYLIQFMKEC